MRKEEEGREEEEEEENKPYHGGNHYVWCGENATASNSMLRIMAVQPQHLM
jgi:hypothetical protein